MPKQMWSDVPRVDWHGLTAIDPETGEAVLSFITDAGEVIRYRVHAEHLRHITEAATEYRQAIYGADNPSDEEARRFEKRLGALEARLDATETVSLPPVTADRVGIGASRRLSMDGTGRRGDFMAALTVNVDTDGFDRALARLNEQTSDWSELTQQQFLEGWSKLEGAGLKGVYIAAEVDSGTIAVSASDEFRQYAGQWGVVL